MFETALALLDWLVMIAQYLVIPLAVVVTLISKTWSQLMPAKDKGKESEAGDWSGYGKFVIGMTVTGIIAFFALGVVRDLIPSIGATAQQSVGF